MLQLFQLDLRCKALFACAVIASVNPKVSWLASATDSVSPCANELGEWLTPVQNFPRKDEKPELQGLHVLCLWQPGKKEGLKGLQLHEDVVMEAYMGGVHQPPLRTSIASASLGSWKSFRADLKRQLGFRKATNEWGYLHLKQGFGLFDRKGLRLASPESVVGAQLVLLFEGGQWLWPPVAVGFVRTIPDMDMQLETLSVQPLVFRVRGFLHPEECDEIIRLGVPHMEESPVTLMDKDKGRAAKEFRTSTQARLDYSASPLLAELDLRVANLTRVPVYHNEQVQILRYREGQYYASHLDNWDPVYYSSSETSFMQHGHHNRLSTVFWYLNTAEAGGHTLFPRAYGLQQPHNMWDCSTGLKVPPEKGTVVLWYSLRPNGNTDPNGLHAGCPVQGNVEKWSANFWVWNKPQQHRGAPRLPDEGLEADNDGFGYEDGWGKRLMRLVIENDLSDNLEVSFPEGQGLLGRKSESTERVAPHHQRAFIVVDGDVLVARSSQGAVVGSFTASSKSLEADSDTLRFQVREDEL